MFCPTNFLPGLRQLLPLPTFQPNDDEMPESLGLHRDFPPSTNFSWPSLSEYGAFVEHPICSANFNSSHSPKPRCRRGSHHFALFTFFFPAPNKLPINSTAASWTLCGCAVEVLLPALVRLSLESHEPLAFFPAIICNALLYSCGFSISPRF